MGIQFQYTKNNSGEVVRAPLLAEFEFPVAGERPAIRFDGSIGIALKNDEDLYLPDMTISVVVVHNVGRASQCIYGLYVPVTGVGLGISDGVAGRIKWFSAQPVDSLEPSPGGDLVDGEPTIITATVTADGEKELWVNSGSNRPGCGTDKKSRPQTSSAVSRSSSPSVISETRASNGLLSSLRRWASSPYQSSRSTPISVISASNAVLLQTRVPLLDADDFA